MKGLLFNVGDAVFSVYTGQCGVVMEVYKDLGLQDFYLIKWLDGKRSVAAREEVY